jgi:hypothetical protein
MFGYPYGTLDQRKWVFTTEERRSIYGLATATTYTRGAFHSLATTTAWHWGKWLTEQHQPSYIRDIFGSPFRSIQINPAWLNWNDGKVRITAQSIYDERAFDRLPILADALLDAGCDIADILNHCRSAGPHVRGCWVVDLLLGKE